MMFNLLFLHILLVILIYLKKRKTNISQIAPLKEHFKPKQAK